MMKTPTSAYRLAVGSALATGFLLLWVVGAVGLVGVEGDPADLMYFGVLGVGLVGALLARFRPRGMSRALVATAFAQMAVAGVAMLLGRHLVPVSSVAGIVLSNGFFATLWLGSAWLFRSAAQHPGRRGREVPAGSPPRAETA